MFEGNKAHVRGLHGQLASCENGQSALEDALRQENEDDDEDGVKRPKDIKPALVRTPDSLCLAHAWLICLGAAQESFFFFSRAAKLQTPCSFSPALCS